MMHKLLCWFGIHDYPKWSEPTLEGGSTPDGSPWWTQRRVCVRCNIIHDRVL